MIPTITPYQNPVRSETQSDQQKLQQAAQGFEAIFVRNMIGAMRAASLGEDLLANKGSDQFRTLMDDRIADQMVQQNGLGIADMLVSQWKDKI